MFKKIKDFFQKLFNSPLLQKFEDFCKEVFIAEKPLLLGALRNIAVSAVQTAQRTGLDSSSKREQAFNEIAINAKNIGIVASASIISLALEMALQAIKNKEVDS